MSQSVFIATDLLQDALDLLPQRALQEPFGGRRDARNRSTHPRGPLTHEPRGQIRDIFGAVAERNEIHLDDAEPIVQVRAESAGDRLGPRVSTRGGDDGPVGFPGLERADSLHPRRILRRAAASLERTREARPLRPRTACPRRRARTDRPSFRWRRWTRRGRGQTTRFQRDCPPPPSTPCRRSHSPSSGSPGSWDRRHVPTGARPSHRAPASADRRARRQASCRPRSRARPGRCCRR